MIVNDIVSLAMAAGILLAACVLGWRFLATLRDVMKAGHDLSTECLGAMQEAHTRLLGKFETWHEQDIAASRKHTERVMEAALVPPDERSALANRHGLERHDETVTSATRAGNERVADLHTTIARAGGSPKPSEPKRPERTEVPRSAASQAREALHAGAIPQRRR
jgi:hypothetical protein